MGLGKEAPIILICRSGDRSSKAQDRLQTAGFTRVYSIAEGFEGTVKTTGTGTYATVQACTSDAVTTANYTTPLQGPCCLQYMKY